MPAAISPSPRFVDESASAADPADIDVTRRTLRVHGREVEVGSRAFELLLALASRPGRLVNKTELMAAAWGAVDVGDFNLHVQISNLRKLLPKGAIVTVPGRGYVFGLRLRGVAPALEASAPSARAVNPAPELFGRAHDIAAVLALVRSHAVTVITGAGGIGKSTLARAVLRELPQPPADGMARIDLATARSEPEIASAMATALHVALGPGDALTALARALQPLEAVLLFDNAEGAIHAVASLIGALLERCPRLRFVVTTQVKLKLVQANHYRLGALAYPEKLAAFPTGVATPPHYPALALFEARVRAFDGRFRLRQDNLHSVAELCRLLDGVPLALELAAARCATLGLAAVQAQLDARLRWPNGLAPVVDPHQKSLTAAMDWSHSLLTPAQRSAFNRLGVFRGGFTLAMAHGVWADLESDETARADLLVELLDHCLVHLDDAQPWRYRLLETARSYALERLAQDGRTEHAQRLHARSLGSVFEQAYRDCWDLPEADFVARYEPELDNLRAALHWAQQRDFDAAIALAGASGRLWRWLSLHSEGLRWMEGASTLIDAQTPLPLAPRLWEAIALQYGESSSVDGRAAARRAAALYADLGDRRGRYLALAHLTYTYRSVDEGEEASEAFEELRSLEDPTWPPSVRLFGARIEVRGASPDERIAIGRSINQTRLALATAAGSDYEINSALVNLADLALMAGDADEAVRRNREVLARLSNRHLASRAIGLGNLLEALVTLGDLAQARCTMREWAQAAQQLDHMFGMFAADAIGLLCALEGDFGTAGHLLGYADRNYAAHHRQRGPNEQTLRDRCGALLAEHAAADELERWMEQGARLSAADVCKLALNSSAR
jgi:predicted ATPase/DNA-binding winged helix-turn-helix (wHTH) protein